MPDGPAHNPYAPPTSSLENGDWEQDEARHKRQSAGIRSATRLAVCSGLFFLIFAICLPHILRWQAVNTLRPHGAEKHVELVVSLAMEKIGYERILTGVLAALSIAAGALIQIRRAPGLYLLMLVCAAFIGNVIAGIAMQPGQSHAVAILRGAWWAFVFYAAFRANRQRAV